MGKYPNSAGLRQAGYAVFAAIAVVLIAGSIALLIIGPAYRWPIAAVGVFSAAALEVGRMRVGNVRHRSPIISFPVIALPGLAPAVPQEAAVGVIALGVLLAILVRANRVPVALFAAGLVGAGGVISIGIFEWVRAAGFFPALASGIACAGFVVFLLLIEVIRMRFIKAPVDRGGASMLSPLRVTVAVLGCAVLSAIAAHWSDTGLPYIEDRSESLNSIIVLLLLTLIAAGAKLVSRHVIMRRRLTGLIRGASAMTTSNRLLKGKARGKGKDGVILPSALSETDAATLVSGMLCRTVADTIGVESVTVREQPPAAGEIGASVRLAENCSRFVVARRDFMDDDFTVDDQSALDALAYTANIVIKSHRNVGGLTARANTDQLTGLPNYGAFQDALTNINEHRNYSEALAVLFLDLDDFKRLNDRYGHQVGDEFLRGLGRRLRKAVRPHDLVARVGGDEFVIILTELSSLAEAKGIAERIMTASGVPLSIGANTFSPRLSIGLAYSAHRETDITQLVKDADRSMLAIKKSRRDGSPARESSINISGHRSSEMNDIVVRAIDEGLLELAFQPIVNLVTKQIWGFEALVRYTHPELGPLSPSSLVAKAKGLGRLDKLTHQVALKAMSAAAEFRLIDPHIACMAINVEAGQIMPERVGSFLADLASRYRGISLCLELNERSLDRVSTAVRWQAERLRDEGIMIALDDYGSHDSSVDSLVRMPMDILKIDRSLVDDLDDIRQREVLTALQGFGDKLEYSMIVEGVENDAMAVHLNALGIRNAQGFHYGTPQSFEKTRARLEEFGAAAVLPHSTALPTGPGLLVSVAMTGGSE